MVRREVITNSEFAARCNISTGMANKVLNKKVNVTVGTLCNIASGLSVSLSDLLVGVDHRVSQTNNISSSEDIL